jgi:CheY-like chemotaxis protein
MNPAKPRPGRISLSGLTLLIVEDETIVSFLLEDMLGDLGCSNVLHAGRVSQALALLREHRPDAVVLDVNLGGEYAYPVAAQLAEAQIPFVFTTGYGNSGILGQWASRPVVQKPFSLDGLAAALRQALPNQPSSA